MGTMMKIKVIRNFKDKLDKKSYKPGDERTVTTARGRTLVKAGYAEAVVDVKTAVKED